MKDAAKLDGQAHVENGLTRTILTGSVLTLTLLGAMFVVEGINLSRLVGRGAGSGMLLSTYAYQGYIVLGIAAEVGALIIMVMQYKAGRIALAISSVVFLNLAFLWTSRGPGDTLAVNLLISNLALAFVGVGVDTGMGIAVFDLVFLSALAIAFVSVYMLSRGGRTRAFLNSLILASALTLILSLEVYLWDRGELNLHFTSLSPPWFTNAVLAVSSSIVLLESLCVRALLGLRRRKG